MTKLIHNVRLSNLFPTIFYGINCTEILLVNGMISGIIIVITIVSVHDNIMSNFFFYELLWFNFFLTLFLVYNVNSLLLRIFNFICTYQSTSNVIGNIDTVNRASILNTNLTCGIHFYWSNCIHNNNKVHYWR